MTSEKERFLLPEDMIPTFMPFTQLSQSTDWGLLQAGIPEAHKLTKGAGIKIAVLDTGSSDHRDLAPNIIDSWDATGHGNPMDFQGHGTHVGGIIAALDNEEGVLGVAPESKLYCIKVLDNSGHGGYAAIAAGIRKAIEYGVDIINMSLGSPRNPTDPSFHQAIKEAHDAGIFIVAAAGNDGGRINFPARYNEVIAVGAINQNGDLCSFTSLGPEMSVVAPGDNIYSTWLNNQYAVLKGTSQAAPFVSGLIALILSKHRNNPSLTQIKTLQDLYPVLNDLCDPKGRILDGKEGNIGFGIPRIANNF